MEPLPNVPDKFVAGDTLSWRVRFDDWTSSDGAVLYKFTSKGKEIDVTAVPDGDGFLVTITAAESAKFIQGSYVWAAFGVDDPANIQVRHTLDQGRTMVSPNLLGLTAPLDGRSHAQVVLDAIQAVIEKRATKDQESYTISGRSLSRTPLKDLIELRNLYRNEVRAEERQAKADRGEPVGGKIRGAFSNG